MVINARTVLLMVPLVLGSMGAQAEWDGGDAGAGALAWNNCQACHTLEAGVHRVGPSLAGLWGSEAGTVEGFMRYSDVVKASGIIWDPATLFEYLERPREMIPGSRMTYAGMPSEKDRRDLIAYMIEQIGAP